MGSWFSNIHIRKQDHITEETIVECIKKMMNERGFSSTHSEEEADTSIALYFSEGSRWFSIFCLDRSVLAADDHSHIVSIEKFNVKE